MPNLLVIHGSHRTNGITEQLATDALSQLEDAVTTEVIRVRDMTIDHCTACTACAHTGGCVLSDDMGLIYDAIQRSDAVLVTSPVYFNHITSRLKQVIDRLEPYFFRKMKLSIPHSIPSFYFVFSSGVKLKAETKAGIMQTMDILTKAFNGEVKDCIWVEETDQMGERDLVVENHQILNDLHEKLLENFNKIRAFG